MLDDIYIQRAGEGGDGRTVTAYAAIFNSPYEVHDQYGNYMETIERSAFNRHLGRYGMTRTLCLYNHGMDLRGRSEAKYGIPLGTPLKIEPDNRGLLTVTRYNRGEVADLVLASVENGDIRSQSFRGGIFKSSPNAKAKLSRRPDGSLPTVTRNELGISDYGPTPIAVNTQDMQFAVRSLAQDFAALDEEQRAELIRALSSTPPARDQETTTAPSSNEEPGAEDQSIEELSLAVGPSGRLAIARARMQLDRIKMGATRHG
jgi:phage head maturation protease